jgi:hypothetical protein
LFPIYTIEFSKNGSREARPISPGPIQLQTNLSFCQMEGFNNPRVFLQILHPEGNPTDERKHYKYALKDFVKDRSLGTRKEATRKKGRSRSPTRIPL